MADPIDLYIRPEELTRQDPSRVQVTQTNGGAWVDDFGAGLASLSISGHTGWRGTDALNSIELFLQLRDTVFDGWHRERKQRRLDGRDPDEIELVFLDLLDRFSVVVVPQDFKLRRSKARPLLMQYSINMIAIAELSAPITVIDLIEAQTPRQEITLAALNAIEISEVSLMELADELASSDQPKLKPLVELARKSALLLRDVRGLVDKGISVFDAAAAPIIAAAAIANTISHNITSILQAPLALTARLRATIQVLANTFRDAACNLLNNFPSIRSFFDFSGLFGASNCSSTRGGSPASPYRNDNAFILLFPAAEVVAPFTSDGIASINLLAGDPLELNSKSLEEKLALAAQAADGMRVDTDSSASVVAVQAGNPFQKLRTNLRRATTRHRDTLQRVAARELGDASKWYLIASLNKLLPPYLTDDQTLVGDNVLLTGSTVLLPSAGVESITLSPLTPEATFGTDASLSNGSLTAGTDGDLAVIAGRGNLVQALQIRITTDLGELLFHPEYGCGVVRLKGQGLSPATAQLGQELLTRALRADSRVARVEKPLAAVSGDELRISAIAVTNYGAPVPVEA